MKTRLALVVAACGLAVLANSSVVLPGIGEATVVCAEGGMKGQNCINKLTLLPQRMANKP